MGTWSLDEERESFQCKIGRWRPLNIRVFTVDARAQFRARGVKTTSGWRSEWTHLSELALTWAWLDCMYDDVNEVDEVFM